MIGCRTAIAAAVAVIGLATFNASSEAKAESWSPNAAYCLWYWQQARITGDEYWRDRWRRCLRGDDWDQPRRNFSR
jgi:hypothetical protein